MTREHRRAEAEKMARQLWETILDADFRDAGFGGPLSVDTLRITERIAAALIQAEDRGAQAERAAWLECIKGYGPMLLEAEEKDAAILNDILRNNLWPVPKTCVSNADVDAAADKAIRLRPLIEAEGRRGATPNREDEDV